MPIMYHKGTEPIDAHPSQVENMERKGWSLEKPFQKKKVSKVLSKSKTIKEGE